MSEPNKALLTVKDGKIVHFKLFQTRAEALQAVGLAKD
jgi:hypothetical protein